MAENLLRSDFSRAGSFFEAHKQTIGYIAAILTIALVGYYLYSNYLAGQSGATSTNPLSSLVGSGTTSQGGTNTTGAGTGTTPATQIPYAISFTAGSVENELVDTFTHGQGNTSSGQGGGLFGLNVGGGGFGVNIGGSGSSSGSNQSGTTYSLNTISQYTAPAFTLSGPDTSGLTTLLDEVLQVQANEMSQVNSANQQQELASVVATSGFSNANKNIFSQITLAANNANSKQGVAIVKNH